MGLSASQMRTLQLMARKNDMAGIQRLLQTRSQTTATASRAEDREREAQVREMETAARTQQTETASAAGRINDRASFRNFA